MEGRVVDRDPDAIKQDIDQARDRLASTVDALAERANPQRIANDVKAVVIRFITKPAVVATVAGLGAVTVIVVIRNRRR